MPIGDGSSNFRSSSADRQETKRLLISGYSPEDYARLSARDLETATFFASRGYGLFKPAASLRTAEGDVDVNIFDSDILFRLGCFDVRSDCIPCVHYDFSSPKFERQIELALNLRDILRKSSKPYRENLSGEKLRDELQAYIFRVSTLVDRCKP